MSSDMRTSGAVVVSIYNNRGLVFLLAGPRADRPGVHVDEAALRVEPDAADPLGLGPALQLLRGHAGDEEVDRVAVAVLAVARDLVALLAQDQVVLGVAKPGDHVDDVA